MTNEKECPNCGSLNTERVHVEWYQNGVEQVRICNDCPTQYTVGYDRPFIVNSHTLEE